MSLATDPKGYLGGAIAPPKRSVRVKDFLFERSAMVLSLLVVALIAWIAWRLYADSSLTIRRYGTSFLTTSVWDVPHEVYGAATFVFGTVVSSALALLLAVPISVGASVFLTEVAPRWLSAPVAFVIEFLAAIPSIVYGLWGFLVLCPFLQNHVSPWLAAYLGSNPLFTGPPVITNMLAAGVILAIMVTPIVTAVSREVLRNVPTAIRDASLACGATQWETVRHVILPEARSGITGAVILGLGRALGETMAVVMVIGNTPQIRASILQPGYTMPSLLANQFNEAYNDPVQRSALLEIALILFVVTFLVNAAARIMLLLTRRQGQGKVLERVRIALEWLGGYAFRALAAAFIGYQVYCDLRAGRPGWVEAGVLAAAVIYGGSLLIRGVSTNRRWRRLTNRLMVLVLSACAFVACFVLGALLYYVVRKGIGGLTPSLFTELPRPPGVEGGGLKNAILGTVELIAIASVFGIPIGLMGGVYIAEFGKGKVAESVRFAADVLNGIPSVVIGLFAYAAFVLPFGHFSAWSGGAALAVMMVPTIVRTTEEILRLIPSGYREGAMGLGASRAQMVRSVVLPAARNGILTGVLLAIARVAGETAPLLFTAFGSEQVNTNPSQPVSSLTMKVYQYAISPYDDWIQQAWAGALVLLIMIAVLNLTARAVAARTSR